MKSFIKLLLVFLFMISISACTVTENKILTNLTIPENTKYFVSGGIIHGGEESQAAVFENNLIFYFSENGEMLGKEQLFDDDLSHIVSYLANNMYITAYNKDILRIDMQTGEVATFYKIPEKNAEIWRMKVIGNSLFMQYAVYETDYRISKNAICILNVDDANDKKCLELDGSGFDAIVVNKTVYAWNLMSGELIEYDLNLEKISSSQIGTECILSYDDSNLYVLYSEEILDVSDGKKYSFDLPLDFYEHRINGEELILAEIYITEGGEENSGVFTQVISAYNIISGKKQREKVLSPGYGTTLFNDEGNVYISSYDELSMTIIPFDFATFELSQTELVINAEEKGSVILVYGLYEYSKK